MHCFLGLENPLPSGFRSHCLLLSLQVSDFFSPWHNSMVPPAPAPQACTHACARTHTAKVSVPAWNCYNILLIRVSNSFSPLPTIGYEVHGDRAWPDLDLVWFLLLPSLSTVTNQLNYLLEPVRDEWRMYAESLLKGEMKRPGEADKSMIGVSALVSGSPSCYNHLCPLK